MTDWERTGFFRGFIPTKDKKPLKPYKDKPDSLLSLEKVRSMGTDYAGVLKDNAVMLDADGEPHSENLLKVIQGENLPCLVTGREGGRGNHALFFDQQGLVSGCFTGVMLACGILVDIKIGSRNGYESLKHEGVEREPLYDAASFGNLPKYLTPLKHMDSNSQVEFWNLEEGAGRNQALFNYILALTRNGFTDDEAREAIEIMNNYILKDPVSETELQVILRNDAFKKQLFFKGSTFLFDQFAEYLRHKLHIKRINGQLHMYRDGAYLSGYREIEAEMVRHLQLLSKTKRKEVLEYLELLCLDNEPTAHARKIAFRNGILDIETGSFGSFSPDYIITNKIDWDYNPNAYHELMDQVLDKISCFDPAIRALLEEAVGYSFFRENKLGKAFILTGESGNGKSTYLDCLKYLLGEENHSTLDLKKLDDRFSTVMLVGMLANIGDDISDEFLVDPSVFKKLVTGESLDAEYKGRDKFSFKPYAKMYFSANNIPRIGRGKGWASIKRRLIIIPFNAKFSRDDPDYRPYIANDLQTQEGMEYLIALGVQGLKRILENKGFSRSEKVEKEIEEFDLSNDPVLAFIEECKDEEYGIVNEALNDVYNRYQGFCIRSNHLPLAKNEFSKQIQRRLNIVTDRKRINGKQTQVFIEACTV